MEIIQDYNVVDAFILIMLLIGLILGLWKGFVRSFTALASLVVGVIAAVRYYRVVEPYLGKVSSLDPNISMILSMVIVFVFVQAVFVLIRLLLDALVDATRLSVLDRLLGGAMGVAAAFLVVAVVVQVILIGIPEWPIVTKSKFTKPTEEVTKKLWQYVPQSAKDQVADLMKRWKGSQDTQQPKPAPKGDTSKKPATSAPAGAR
ncbi:MAG: CvpA family protein [Thermodesulfobacteriota bacterium]